MKKSFAILLLLISFCNLFSQKAKIIAGGGISKIKSSTAPVLDKNVFVISGGIGLDWLEQSNYYISSELNYTQIGGKEINSGLPSPYTEMQKKWGFVLFHQLSGIRYL